MKKGLLCILFLVLFSNGAQSQDLSALGDAIGLFLVFLCSIVLVSGVPPLCFLLFLAGRRRPQETLLEEFVFWTGTALLIPLLPLLCYFSFRYYGSKHLFQAVAELRSGDTSFPVFDFLGLCINAAFCLNFFLFATAVRLRFKRLNEEKETARK